MTNNLPENLQAARLLCSMQWSYLASALWAMQPVETKGLGTFAVDKYWRFYYDPDLKWDVKGIATALYHEVNHLLRNHCLRAENMPDFTLNAGAINDCQDAEINDDIIKEQNVSWPILPVMPSSLKQPDNLLWEEYYQNLPKKHIQIGGNCGSGAHGVKQPHELDGPADKGEGKSDTPGMTQGEGDLLRRHVANEISSSANRGSIPEHWKRWAEDVLNPKVDWRKVLTAQIRHSVADIVGKKDYTFKRPSRRQIPKVILPTMQQPVPRVAQVWDVSGSIGQDALNGTMAESRGIFKACGVTGQRVYVVDAAIHSARKVYDPRQVELSGGGGTDMRIGIEAAMKVPPYERPHLIVVFTDGYTPWPDQAPNAKVIIVLLNTVSKPEECPSWAKVIKID